MRETLKSILRKERNRKYIRHEASDYFLANKPRLGRSYLLPRISKRLCNALGRPVISIKGYYTENISDFRGCYLKAIVQNVKSDIKDIIDFLCKVDVLPSLPEYVI